MILSPLRPITANFLLPASKSLANRALIIQALCQGEAANISNTGDAADVLTMQRLLSQVADGVTLDCGPAGTTFRFLTAFLCLQPGTQTLTGSTRMLQRPIGALVDALRGLGASITYLGEEGYPPLRIGSAALGEASNRVTVPGNISSQYLSALLLIGPCLPRGLTLNWTGELVSRPYLEMTLKLMQHFGADITMDTDAARVLAQAYQITPYEVESDWSAASYAAAWIALSEVGTSWHCKGLRQNSLQGDRQLTNWIAQWGVKTDFDDSGASFRKTKDLSPPVFECDFETSPDLAQTFAVLAACTGTTALLTGLQTLSIKETDRIAALKTELAKVNVFMSKLPPKFTGAGETRTFYMIEGRASWEGTVQVETYHDHRMGMAFALLASRGPVEILDEAVVGKSFPQYWTQLTAASTPR